MSNRHMMEIILKKFPIQENVDWSKHLAKMANSVKEKLFPEFMKWLEEARASWELLAAQGSGTESMSSGGGKGSFYGDHKIFFGEK